MLSIVDFYGKQSNYSCGYCKQPKSCQSHGMWAHTMTVQDYQSLIDRGWRRSGCYCYKPEMSTTCCPSYTIKCNAMSFRLNKSHKKIIKRVNKYLKDGIRPKDQSTESGSCDGDAGDTGGELEMADVARNPRKELHESTMSSIRATDEILRNDMVDGPCMGKPLTTTTISCSNFSGESSIGRINNPPKKAKLMRIERKREKLMQKGLTSDDIVQNMQSTKRKNTEKSLEDFLNEAPKEDAAHRLKVKLVPSNEGATDLVYSLYCSYQMAVHKDPPTKLKMDSYKRFLVKSPLKVITICTKSDEFNRSLGISFALYEKYQTAVHNDPLQAIDDYKDFLVKSPLKFVTGTNSPNCGLGSFHQQYWLDDRLIAVGVIDILSNCVSSVYFFYDPEFRFLSLGTYGSLREIAFTRQLQQQKADISNYYMGFYIHSCPKMRYKSNLSPSYLLCPEVYSWHPLDQKVCVKLDRNKYSRLNEDPNASDQNSWTPRDLLDVLVLVGSSYMRYSSYMEMMKQNAPEQKVKTYAKLVGKVLASRMLLYEG
ncbi:arginyl-tRNA--protein transferase 1 isoform X1 [Malaya genurostris]|uniref:arginyl-tRNA--protein transferase 1 isoform X1 n=1 Tax=Malaya genurostris TaxID=325434 RepID=UPI0026F3B9A3|nr:arginyl-tRNA--protein transferase 1 isoform X1 [Malaya genurostris]